MTYIYSNNRNISTTFVKRIKVVHFTQTRTHTQTYFVSTHQQPNVPIIPFRAVKSHMHIHSHPERSYVGQRSKGSTLYVSLKSSILSVRIV